MPATLDSSQPITWLTAAQCASTSGLNESDIIRFVDLGRLPGYLINSRVMISQQSSAGSFTHFIRTSEAARVEPIPRILCHGPGDLEQPGRL